MARVITVAIIMIALLWLLLRASGPSRPTFDESLCAGPPLIDVQARSDAMEAGYEIRRDLDCIDKTSFEAINAQQTAWEQRDAQKKQAERATMAIAGASTFAQARHGFVTKVALHDEQALPLPSPPSNLFVRSDYKNPQNYLLPGYVTPDPGDGRRHPAIVWITGGDSNSLDDFWSRGPDSNDQSAAAFRQAGMVMAFPTLRGGNGHRAAKELMLGEVDDVIAAANQLSKLSYVDPDRIYLGGHSTGGTLALLTAELKTRFKAVFAFGPVAGIDHYPQSIIPIDFGDLDAMESKLRSPIHWLDNIAQPTYVIEGADGGNLADFDELCAASRNRFVHCIRVAGAGHFSAIRPVTLIIAGRIAAAAPDDALINQQEFAK